MKGQVVETRCSLDPDTGLIFTDAEIQVDEPIKGAPPDRITVRHLGGQVGELRLDVSHEPVFRMGEEVIVFLSPYPAENQLLAGHLGVVGGIKGKLTIQDEHVLELQLPEDELLARLEALLAGEDVGPDPYFVPLNALSSSSSPSLSDATLGPLSYSYTEKRWPGSYVNVGYYIYTIMEPRDLVLNAIKRAAYTWNEVGSRFKFVYKGTTTRYAGYRDSYNVVEFVWDFGPTGWPARTLIWSIDKGAYKNIVECDMELNVYYPWAIGSIPGYLDLQNVVTHEFGHFLCLNDLYRWRERNMTMYGYVTFGETKKRTLAGPDKMGILHIYGKR